MDSRTVIVPPFGRPPDHDDVTCFPPEDCYDLPSNIGLKILRYNASFFAALPPTDKHDLIYWLIENIPPPVLQRILTIGAEASHQNSTASSSRTPKRRLDQNHRGEEEPAPNRRGGSMWKRASVS